SGAGEGAVPGAGNVHLHLCRLLVRNLVDRAAAVNERGEGSEPPGSVAKPQRLTPVIWSLPSCGCSLSGATSAIYRPSHCCPIVSSQASITFGYLYHFNHLNIQWAFMSFTS